MKKINNKAFTLVELLICILIFSTFLLIALYHWGSLTKQQAINKDRIGIISSFEKARSLAIASKSNSDFGLNISSSTITVFQGDVYNPADTTNTYYVLNGLVQVSVISLNGGGNNVVFSRLSGETNQYGSIKISLINTPASSSTITILESGVVQ